MKHKYKYVILIIISVFLLILSFLYPMKVKTIQRVSKDKYSLPIMKKDDIYEAHIKSSLEDISSFGIRFATYSYKNNHGTINIDILDNDYNLIKSKKVNINEIVDNEMYYLNFKKQKNSKSNEYIIKIYFDKYYDDVKLTLWGNYLTDYDNYVLNNNNNINMDLFTEIYGYKSSYHISLYLILVIIFNLIMLTCGGEKDD